jgi:hypothetical protein
MNLIGFVQALLINIGILAGLDNPQYKVTPVGFLQSLLENPTTAKISNASQISAGQDKVLKVRYLQRGLESEVTDVDDCETPTSPDWKESQIGRPLFSKIGIFISDENMRKYQDEAAKTLQAGTPTSPLMVALYETLITKLQGIIQKIDGNLLSAQAAKWGVNAVTGLNAAQNINFSNTPVMNDGIVKLLTDYQLNEMVQTPLIVGNGAVMGYNTLQGLKTGTDNGGFGANQTFRFYNDVATISKWGANHFGVFAPGMIGFVDFNKNVGPYAGEKGGAIFFTIPVPVMLANGTLTQLVFDAQLQYETCPQFDEVGVKIADRGWKLIVSKSYGLFNAPNDMFAVGDRLAGVNGAFHYVGAVQNATIIAPASGSIFPNA